MSKQQRAVRSTPDTDPGLTLPAPGASGIARLGGSAARLRRGPSLWTLWTTSVVRILRAAPTRTNTASIPLRCGRDPGPENYTVAYPQPNDLRGAGKKRPSTESKVHNLSQVEEEAGCDSGVETCTDTNE